MSLFRPSGGVLYHWRAWRNKSEWTEFLSEVEQWLNEWPQTSDELLLVGPSAGYTLPTSWLKKFSKIHAFDLDPLAPWMFRRQHPGVNVRFHRQDVFWDGHRYSTKPFRPTLQEHPDAMILLCNVLGQLLLEHPIKDRPWEFFLNELRTTLRERQWASYHDLYTHESGQVIDHMTDGDWKSGLDARQFRWAITNKSIHLIEGLRE